MSRRPEGNDSGGYDAVEPPDSRAWEEFTPWRPGDKSTERNPANEPPTRERQGFKWSEDQPAVFFTGDRVRSTKPVGGLLGGAVPSGTLGEVISTRKRVSWTITSPCDSKAVTPKKFRRPTSSAKVGSSSAGLRQKFRNPFGG